MAQARPKSIKLSFFPLLSQGLPLIPEFTRPPLYPKQEAAIFCPHRFAVVEAGKKVGVTVGCIAWMVEKVFQYSPGQNAWWIATAMPQGEAVYRRMKRYLTPGSFTASANPPRLELISGGVIWIKSAESLNSLSEENVCDVVIDSPAGMKPEIWSEVSAALLPTHGKARLGGTVRGKKNFFYDLARLAESKTLPDWHYSRITCYDAIEAGILDPKEVEDARKTLPEVTFRELYLAEPCDEKFDRMGRQTDPRLLSDEELALIANLEGLDKVPDKVLMDLERKQLVA